MSAGRSNRIGLDIAASVLLWMRWGSRPIGAAPAKYKTRKLARRKCSVKAA